MYKKIVPILFSQNDKEVLKCKKKLKKQMTIFGGGILFCLSMIRKYPIVSI